MSGKVYLIPNTLGDTETTHVLPSHIIDVVTQVQYFIVEDLRTARRFLKKCNKDIVIDKLTFFELNKHTDPRDIFTFLKPAKAGHAMGIISEAGCPGVADPGAEIVKLAHEANLQVVPLVGPSSILLSLMASGLNGQNFAFVGYLPFKADEVTKRITFLETRSSKEYQTQIFIETPFRNQKLFELLLQTCRSETRLCVACDITMETEYIVTKTISEWKKQKLSDLDKRPTIFLMLGQ